ncbi:MAG TPA: alpha/beta hydrolase [Burkholderiaceae bacterium]|nr:alpha/beta hydrolase [Burkholderiaceae bacterium]
MNTLIDDTVAPHDAGAQVRTPQVKPLLKTVALSTGVTLPFVEQGDPAGVPVVMLHGLTDSWHSFERVLPHLPGSIRALVPTQRGHGDASRPVSGYRTRDFAADVEAFLDALEVERAVIVGHSLGSTNALRFAIDCRHRVHGLILVGAFAGYRSNPVIAEFWDSGVSTLADPIDASFAREFQESTLARPVPREFIDLAVSESLKVPARVWRDALAGCLEDDFAAGIATIKTPTLAVWGARDALVPRADQEHFLAQIAGSRLVVYQDGGHAPHWEEPARFAADVSAFVATLQS